MIAKVQIDKERFLKIVLWVIIIAFIASYIPLFFTSDRGNSNSVAVVNGVDLSRPLVQHRTALEIERLAMIRHQLGPQADFFLKSWGIDDPEKVALQALIEDTLLNQVAKKAGIVASPSFIEHSLQDQAFVMRNLLDVVPLSAISPEGRIDMRAIERYYGTSYNFEQAVEDKVVRSLVLQLVDTTLTLLPQELEQEFDKKFRARSYQILTLNVDSYLNKVKKDGIAPAALEKFYQDKTAKSRHYMHPEMRSATIYYFDPSKYGIKISDQEVEQFYKQNKAMFVDQPAKLEVRHIVWNVTDSAKPEEVKVKEEQAKKVAEELKENPSIFAELAKKYSEDRKTADVGGLLAPFSKGSHLHSPEFERAAFRLANDGEVSGVVVTDKGFEIIQRVARIPVIHKPLSAVASSIKERIQKQKFQAAFNSEASKLVQENSPEKIASFIESKKSSKADSGLIAKNDSLLAKRMFGMRIGQWAYYFADGKGHLINLQEIQKSYLPSLDVIKAQVEKDYHQEEAQRLFKKDLALAKKMAQEETLDAVKEKLGGALKTIQLISPATHEPSKLEGIPAQELFSLYRKNSVKTFSEEGHGYVVKVVDQAAFDQGAFNEHKKELAAELFVAKKSLAQKAFIASLNRNATITYKQ